MEFIYRGHHFRRTNKTALARCNRMGDIRFLDRQIWACDGPHGWTADDEQPVTKDDAKAMLRYRISEGITRDSHAGQH